MPYCSKCGQMEVSLSERDHTPSKRKPSRIKKISAWQAFVKNNSKKKKFRFANGKLKLKTMGIAYRKTAAYKRNKKK